MSGKLHSPFQAGNEPFGCSANGYFIGVKELSVKVTSEMDADRQDVGIG
jgi:hypothetical protein